MVERPPPTPVAVAGGSGAGLKRCCGAVEAIGSQYTRISDLHRKSEVRLLIMQGIRDKKANVLQRLKHMPAVALLGPRQCGKTTLAKAILATIPNSVYLDLERDSHANQLQDPETFFRTHRDRLICLDEIQRRPDLFPLLRSELDERGTNGAILMLGSASPELMTHATESLAGRIGFIELTPFSWKEIHDQPQLASSITPSLTLENWWMRGGFPRSLFADDEPASFAWREDFIRTFLERDIRTLQPRIQLTVLSRLWRMCAHAHGQITNWANFSSSLGVSVPTVRHYIELLTGTYLVRLLPAYARTQQKRLVKSPRLYIRDSGVLHALLGIPQLTGLLGHPLYGASWEGLVIEEIVGHLPQSVTASFYRTAAGAEIDLILEQGQQRLAIECKASAAPHVTAGFYNALHDTECTDAWIVAPVEKSYTLRDRVRVGRLQDVIDNLVQRGWR
jgi:uncharacterized protein